MGMRQQMTENTQSVTQDLFGFSLDYSLRVEFAYKWPNRYFYLHKTYVIYHLGEKKGKVQIQLKLVKNVRFRCSVCCSNFLNYILQRAL